MTTQEEIDNRLECIRQHQIHYNESNKKLTDKRLLALLKKDGFYIQRAQLAKDKKTLLSQNDYVGDLAKYSYSAVVEDQINNIDKAKRILRKIMEMDDLPEITNTSGTNQKGVTFESETIKKSKTHIIQAAHLFARLSMDQIKLISGDVVKTSVANYIENTKQLEAQIQELEERNKALKEEEHRKEEVVEP